MNGRTLTRQLLGGLLGLSVLTGTSAAVAGDYQLWREQVTTDQRGLRFEPRATQMPAGATSDYRLWREQVGSGPKQGFVFIVGGPQAVGDYLLWREQVKGP